MVTATVLTTTVGRVDSALLGALGILVVGTAVAAAVRGVREAVYTLAHNAR